MIHQFLALAAIFLVAGTEPASQPETRARNPVLAEQFFEAAKAAKSTDEGVTTVNRALEYDPDHLQANLLLTQLLIDKQDPAAIDQFNKTRTLMGKAADVPASVKADFDALARKITKVQGRSQRWADLKQQYATRYATLADDVAPPGMPSTALAFKRACDLKPDSDEKARSDRAAAAVPKPPAPTDKPDIEGAKLLYARANRMLADSKYVEAAELLKSVISLDPDQPGPLVDLAVCCQQQTDSATAAACLLAARNRVVNEKDTEAAKRLEAKIKTLLDGADPKLKRIDDLDRQLVSAAKLLADQAAAAGDNDTPWQIDDFLNAMGLSGSADTNPAKFIALLKDKAAALGFTGDSMPDQQRQAAMKEWNAWLDQNKIKDRPVRWRLTLGSVEEPNQDKLARLKDDVESARQDLVRRKKDAAPRFKQNGMFTVEIPASPDARAAVGRAEAALAEKTRLYQAAADFPVSFRAKLPDCPQVDINGAADKNSQKILEGLARDGEFRLAGAIQDITPFPRNKRNGNEFHLNIVLTRCTVGQDKKSPPADTQPARPANAAE